MAELDPSRVITNTIVIKHDFSAAEPLPSTGAPGHTDGTRELANALRAALFNQYETELAAIANSIGDIDTGFEAGGSVYRMTLGEKIREISETVSNISASNLSSSYLYRIFKKGILQNHRSSFDLSISSETGRMLYLGTGAAILPNAVLDQPTPLSVSDDGVTLINAVPTSTVGLTDGSSVANSYSGRTAEINAEQYTLTDEVAPPSGRGYVSVSGAIATITLAQPAMLKNGVGSEESDEWPTDSVSALLYETGGTLYKVGDIGITADLQNGTITVDTAASGLSLSDTVLIMYKFHHQRIDTISLYQNDEVVEMRVDSGDSAYPTATAQAYVLEESSLDTGNLLKLWNININPVTGWTDTGTTSVVSVKTSMLEDLRQFIVLADGGNGNQLASNSISDADNTGRKEYLTINQVESIDNLSTFDNAEFTNVYLINLEMCGDSYAYIGTTNLFASIVPDTGGSSENIVPTKLNDGKEYRLRIVYKASDLNDSISAHVVTFTENTYPTGTQQFTVYIPAFTVLNEETVFYVADDGSTYYDNSMTSLARQAPSVYYKIQSDADRGSGVKNSHIQKYTITDDRRAPEIELATITDADDSTESATLLLDDQTMVAVIPSESLVSNHSFFGVSKMNSRQYTVSSSAAVTGDVCVSIIKNIPEAIYGCALFDDIESSTSVRVYHGLTGDYGVYLQLVPTEAGDGDTTEWYNNALYMTNKHDGYFDINLTSTGCLLPIVEYVIIPEDAIIGEYSGGVHVDGVKTIVGAAMVQTITHNFGDADHVALLTFTSNPGASLLYYITKGANSDGVYAPSNAEYFILKSF